MSRKRRIFDLDLPEEPPETFTAVKVPPGRAEARRGPMASAIVENADSLRDREARDAEIRAENDALAHEHVRLKQAGLVTDLIPLDRIVTEKLVRDRAKGPDMELADLVTSIRDIGLSNPIRVEQRADGAYELIQGYRRLMAYRTLLEETGDDARYGRIAAGISARGDALDLSYRRMVDENLVRKDISLGEMALLALTYAADPLIALNDPEKAVAVLFKSASYAKRSHIRAFIPIADRLGETLAYLPEIPRSLGLALAARMEDTPGLVTAIKAELGGWDGRSVQDELGILRRFAGLADGDDAEATVTTGAKAKARPAAGARTSFQIARAHGTAKCVAGAGRLEIRLDRDFSAIDRRRLEAAVRLMLDQLD